MPGEDVDALAAGMRGAADTLLTVRTKGESARALIGGRSFDAMADGIIAAARFAAGEDT